jgi:hypothetical protein
MYALQVQITAHLMPVEIDSGLVPTDLDQDRSAHAVGAAGRSGERNERIAVSVARREAARTAP